MSSFYYYFLVLLLPLVIVLAMLFLKAKKDIPSALFSAALKKENSGLYVEAIVIYEMALKEIKKTRFQTEFKDKIVGKLKVLHTLIAYEGNTVITPEFSDN